MKKLILFALCLSCMATPNAYAQSKRVSINRNKAEIVQVLNDIEKQTNYLFVYGQNVNVKAIKSIQVSNELVSKVLERLFAGTSIVYELKGKHIVLSLEKKTNGIHEPSTPTYNKKHKLTGKVVDDMGEPLIGVSVMVNGSSKGTVTDLDGKYSLDVNGNEEVTFSYIGFTSKTVKVGKSEVLNLTMKEDSKVLNEVVVVGYGVQKKSNVTGAISSVKEGDLENRTITDLNQGLQGKVAGVQLLSSSSAPGASNSIRVRGFSSNSTSNPLYVVDGVRLGDISSVEPSDIESMEILKDAASASIYGAEAGNGVILITTKKGKSGKGTISYDCQMAWQMLQHKPKVLNAEQYLDYMVKSGAMTQQVADGWDGTSTNWADELFETSLMQKHNLSFRGGNDKGTVYASLNYLDNNGIVVGKQDCFKNLSGSLNVDYKIKDWLKLTWDNSVNYYRTNSVAENSEYRSVLRAALALDPLTPVTYTLDNMPANMKSLYDAGKKLIQDGNGNYYSISPYNGGGDDCNPYIYMKSGYNKSYGHNVRGNFALDFTPFKNFVFTSRVGYMLCNANSYNYQGEYYVSGVNNKPKSSISSTVNSVHYYQWENFANYSLSLKKHNLGVMAGMSFSQEKFNYVTTGGDGLLEDLASFAYPSYLSANATALIHDGDETNKLKYSYFGRLSYDYDGRYMAQLSMRADAADLSILPKAERWGYFPAVSLGWLASNEKWFPKTKAFTYAKLRASWGQNGSIAGLGSFAYASAMTNSYNYSFNANNADYTAGYVPSATGNEHLKWETSEQTDLGMDLRFLNDRLTFTMDYFIKKTRDLIVNGSTPTLVIGNTTSPINAGNVENKGFEFELGWKDHVGDFQYSINTNLATLQNKVTYLDPSIARLDGASYNNKVLTAFEKGYPVWYFRGYKVDHIDAQTGDPIYVAQDGSLTKTPTTDDKTMIGSAIPDFTYGISLNMSYKNFDISVFGQGSYGNDIACCLTKTDYRLSNRLECYYKDAWTPEHTQAKYARMDYGEANYWQSSAIIFDASYFRIKQIQLGYTFPKKLISKIGLSNLRVYGSLDDFFTFTSYPGMDPEASAGPTNMLGMDFGVFPHSKKMVVGVNVSF